MTIKNCHIRGTVETIGSNPRYAPIAAFCRTNIDFINCSFAGAVVYDGDINNAKKICGIAENGATVTTTNLMISTDPSVQYNCGGGNCPATYIEPNKSFVKFIDNGQDASYPNRYS